MKRKCYAAHYRRGWCVVASDGVASGKLVAGWEEGREGKRCNDATGRKSGARAAKAIDCPLF